MQPIQQKYREYIERCEPELARGLVDCLETTLPSVSVRVNLRKTRGVVPATACGRAGVPWCDTGFYLPERPDFTHDPALHQGLYYVQDASSMITHHVVRHLVKLPEGGEAARRPIRYLDACAAPGGKTTAAIDALPDGSVVVANEFDFRRASILKENVIKWGYPHVIVTRGDTARFRRLPEWFDVVAADVPCSGEGMMRKDETARLQWSEALVRECAARQREIVANIWTALRPGGYLIYSTCTFNRAENEDNVAWIVDELGGELQEIPLPEGCGIVCRDGGCMRFLPTRLSGEGLFTAVLRKRADICVDDMPRERHGKPARRMKGSGGDLKPATTKSGGVLRDASGICSGWLDGDFLFNADANGNIHAIPSDMAEMAGEAVRVLDVICRGVEVASSKGKTLMPAHALALTTALRPDAFESVEVDKPTALSYLRRESLPGMPAGKGAVLLTYGGHPLGFVNNLVNRANNLYPAAWRILR